MDAHVQAFKANAASKAPEFYAADREGGVQRQEADIVRAIKRFAAIRAARQDKVRSYGDATWPHAASSCAPFFGLLIDHALTTPTDSLHSLPANHAQAKSSELVLDVSHGMPAATEAQLPAAWKQLGQVLDSKDPERYTESFNAAQRPSALPPRRGHCLGHVVSKVAGQARVLSTWAYMSCKHAQALVRQIVFSHLPNQ